MDYGKIKSTIIDWIENGEWFYNDAETFVNEDEDIDCDGSDLSFHLVLNGYSGHTAGDYYNEPQSFGYINYEVSNIVLDDEEFDDFSGRIDWN